MGRPNRCDKKKSYPLASSALAALRVRRGAVDHPLYAFRCQVCGGFHLTKMRPPPEADLEISHVNQGEQR